MKKSILIVEDDEDMQTMYADILESNGYSIEIASDGHEGIEKYKEKKPHLVLLDSSMPNVDGFEAFDKIKKFDSNAKVIMITGYEYEQSKMQNAKKNGLESIITKPVGMEQIISLAKKYLE